MPDQLERVRTTYRRLAPSYDRSVGCGDRLLRLEAGRHWVCQRARGDTLELGVGTGLSLPHYPAGIRLTCVDATPEMLALASERARSIGLEVRFVAGDAEALDLAAGSADTVVFTFSLCTIPQPRRAIDEAWRILRPGGRLLLVEHVRSPLLPVRTVQRLLDPLMHWIEADHLLREPLEDVSARGFLVEELERSRLGIIERLQAMRPG